MRCAPQVHGAARDALAFAHDVFAAEANAATDNPMVFADTREIVSGGNFHGAPVAVAADLLCIGTRAARDDQRAALRSAGQSGVERPAGVPHAPRRPAVGADDGAGDRRGADVGAEDAGASGERRHDPDLGEQGRSRQHEHGRRAEGRARRSSSRATCSPSSCCARVRRSICCAPLTIVAAARCACMISFARACRRSSTTVRRRRDHRDDYATMIASRRSRTRVRDESQLKLFFEIRFDKLARDSYLLIFRVTGIVALQLFLL